MSTTVVRKVGDHPMVVRATNLLSPARIRTDIPIGPQTPLNAGQEMPVPLACVIFWLTIPEANFLPVSHPAAVAISRACIGPSTTHLPYSRAPIAAANVLTAEVPRVPLCYATGQSARVCRGLVIVQESLPTSYIYPKAAQPAFVRCYRHPTYIPGQHSLAPTLKSCALRQETISRSGGAGSLDKNAGRMCGLDSNRAASSGADRLHVNLVQMVAELEWRGTHAPQTQRRVFTFALIRLPSAPRNHVV
ncbi:hypothetical protein B0H14DRAFT_3490522 [Mycena olivaceomarginata]|nr:hypothetical protein B0H14DRAFT_3490522 [Mycena olivaceomarginata]